MEEIHNKNIKIPDYTLKNKEVKASFSFEELLKSEDLEKLKRFCEGRLDENIR